MPNPRQQDHRLHKDDLVSYRYSIVLVKVQWHSFAITNFCINGINVVFPREILINKNAQVFYVDFELKTNIFILFIIKHAQF